MFHLRESVRLYALYNKGLELDHHTTIFMSLNLTLYIIDFLLIFLIIKTHQLV